MSDTPHSPEEDELARAMRSAAGDVDPPVPLLVRGAVARGRRLRAVRRAQVAVAAVTVAATAAGGVVLVSEATEGRPARAAAGGTVAPAAPPAPGPTAPPEEPPAPGEVLLRLLPPGAVAVPDGVPTGDEVRVGRGSEPVTLTVTREVRDELGAGDVTLIVRGGAAADDLTCWDATGTAGFCENSVLPDGGRLRLERNREYPITPVRPGATGFEDGKAGPQGRGAHEWSAHLITPGGVSVFVSADDSTGEKSPEPTRRDPVLTLDQLKAIATDPAWPALFARAQAFAAAAPSGRVAPPAG